MTETLNPTDETFPLQWERIVWSARPAFPRAVARWRTEYILTDFRIVVRRSGRTVDEIAVDDIARIELRQGRLQRLMGTSSVIVHWHRSPDRSPLKLADIRQGPQLSLVLQLLAADRANFNLDDDRLDDDRRNDDLAHDDFISDNFFNAEFVQRALSPDSPSLLRPRHALFAISTLVFSIALAVVTLARHDTLAPVSYAPDDPIAPNGQRRSRADITAFMVSEVMPFARRTFGPLKGGAAQVTCYTCHGRDAEKRDWKMPAVRALPEPELRLAGLERATGSIDPQVRNAIYGYLAHEGKQQVAGYMRGVVVPGMAALLHRPAYDFTKTYNYNRSRAALGCYHCHLVERGQTP